MEKTKIPCDYIEEILGKLIRKCDNNIETPSMDKITNYIYEPLNSKISVTVKNPEVYLKNSTFYNFED